MAFRSLDFQHLAKFNSSSSSDFLDKYFEFVDESIKEESKRTPHKTFAPSSFRCDRRSWFRLRGSEPDMVKAPDRVLEFSAQIGTACHKIIQTNLVNLLKDNWVDVETYVKSNVEDTSSYRFERSDDGLETLIDVSYPPVRFACDGIIRINDAHYLLEIKSSEYSSWNDLSDPKPHHIDQVNCYCTLLGLNNVLFVYIDRQYGDLKCYEYFVSDSVKSDVASRFKHVMEMVDKNLAPAGLPKGDPWCNPSMCPYHKKCNEYGR